MDNSAQVQDPNKPEETLADVVADQEENQADFQAAYNAGGSFKERLEDIASGWQKAPEVQSSQAKEVSIAEEIHTNPELKEPELKGYVEKIETDVDSVVIDPATGQAIMQPAAPQNPQITLPLTDDQIQVGLHHQVYEAIRWLAEWCMRQIKVMRGHS